MTVDRWRRVEHVFDEAQQQPPDTRAAFVADSCAGDDALRAEVLSLLDAQMGRASFWRPPPSTTWPGRLPETAGVSGRASSSAPTVSNGCSERVAAGKSGGPVMNAWAAMWRSRSCRDPCRPTRSVCAGSRKKRGAPVHSTTRTSSLSTTSANITACLSLSPNAWKGKRCADALRQDHFRSTKRSRLRQASHRALPPPTGSASSTGI